MNYRFFVLFYLFYLLIGCSKKEEDKTANEPIVKLEAQGDFLKMKLDDVTMPSNKFSTFKTHGDSTYFYYPGNKNDILVFNTHTGEEVNRIAFNSEGPNGVGNFRSFYVLPDSSFLLLGSPVYLYLANHQAELIDRIDLKGTVISNSSYSSVYGDIGIIDAQTFTIPRMPGGSSSQKSFNEWEKEPLELSYNRISGAVQEVPIFLPKPAFTNNKQEIFYERIVENSGFIYSFDYSENIVKSNNSTSYLSEFYAGSQYFNPADFYQVRAYQGVNDYLSDIIPSPRFRRFFYDEFREVYYRFAYLGEELSSDIEPMIQTKRKSHYSIIILDKDLQKIGETKLPKKTHLMNNYFVNKEGLFLAVDHPDHPDFDENYLTFQKYILK
ncbi:MAG: DUF4221 family protein [Cyclobacteriaceae bacterium]|nr:DUF4221 family protein [Cyclobacteriaceae bacterium]